MRRNILSLLALGSLFLAACTPAEVVVTAQIEQEDRAQEGVTRTIILENMTVDLIPFDRDEVFDSLEAEASEPEPEIPQELLEAQELIADARAEWQAVESRWNTLRDTLQTLSDQLDREDRGSGRYVALFQQWERLNAEYNRIDSRVEQAFERYDSLSKANIEQSEAIKIARENWAEDAFAEVGAVFEARLEEAGAEILTDTTDADGIARFTPVDAGEWWVHARYESPTQILYWNVPVSVPKGEAIEVRLTKENAEERPLL